MSIGETVQAPVLAEKATSPVAFAPEVRSAEAESVSLVRGSLKTCIQVICSHMVRREGLSRRILPIPQQKC